ncbi:DUF2125 domain-containing protein [Gemmobacter nectariphilus]|uniref:DUF2125 domain-containing protein n=1 Tax=Gemmobacter nectariphilus TaxID=220343 RepID=UPI00041F5BD2|nr:DUF2125 domain-containing protein [Gemmobacter nectariphilus]
MRAVLWMAIVALAGWSGWWWFASTAALKVAQDWFTTQQARGWTAAHGTIEVQGFPSRIDLTIDSPDIAPPMGGWGWQAPFVQVLSLSYKPWHLIAAFAPEQRLATPAGPVWLNADKLQASLVLVPGPDLALDRFQLAGDGLRLSGLTEASAAHLSLATRPAVGLALAHDLGIEARGLMPSPGFLARLPPGTAPSEAALARLDATLTFSAALDRHVADSRPEITRITLREARLDWGEIKAFVSGDLAPDGAGFAAGALELRLEGGEKALELAIGAGLIPAEARASWQNALTVLAPQGQALTLPIRLAGGRVSVGPLPLGPAPRLR